MRGEPRTGRSGLSLPTFAKREEAPMARDLASAAPPRRGRLRVYLGSAPGVGKTYRMLDEARRRQERGADVVVGYIECHGRKHTESMLAGLDVIPRLHRTYRGTEFTEMDVEAVLARRPSVVLVDELAHTNIPGGKNAKRWQDVDDLLAAGLDVITTVNIQHLESLNDVVQKITGTPSGRPSRTRWCAGPTRSSSSTWRRRPCAAGWPMATSTRPRRWTPRSPTTSASAI